MNEIKLETQQISSKTTLLNAMILRAWKERWRDAQFGINIKKVLPRGVSGDVYNLADCILQQAIIGSTANSLFLNFLKYALCTHLVSHAAVLKCISKYEHFNRTSCIEALLEFLDDTVITIKCRNKSEEAIITESVVHLLNWLMQIYIVGLKNTDVTNEISDHSCMLERANSVAEKLVMDPFVVCLLYIGQYENSNLYEEIREKFESIKVISKKYSSTLSPATERYLHQLAYINVTNLKVRDGHKPEKAETVTYCLQAMLQFEVLLSPCNEISHYIKLLLMFQRLTNFSNMRVFYELFRASFISLSNVVETNYDTMWGAFTFFKVPFIVKQLSAHYNLGKRDATLDHIPEVVEAFELLLEDNLLLDYLDAKFNCNAVEFILNEWKKQFLVNDVQAKCFAAERESASNILQKRDSTNKQPPVINYIIRAEVPLSGVLKSLETDYNKVQEALCGVLGQVLVGNSFDLILSVAAVEGKLKPLAARLIQCNENSKQIVGETGKIHGIRSQLFDITFIMLNAIVQRYGSNVVLSENGNSFYEHWVRNFMYEPNKSKNFRDMVALCDENIVDELLLMLRSPDPQLRNSNVTWQDTCINLVGVLSHILPAWENDILSINDIEIFLGNCKRRMLSYSACLGSYLISYMDSVRRSEQTKPYSMTSQLLVMKCYEDIASPLQDNYSKERLSLLKTIIKNFRQNYNQSGVFLSNIIAIPQKLTSRTILIEHFNEVWKTILEQGSLSASTGQALHSVLLAGGPEWLAKHLVEEIVKCKFTKDMDRLLDLVFGIMHIDIIKMTTALLNDVILPTVNQQGTDINEPQLLILARLCVRCIISSLEAGQPLANTKKRPRSRECDDVEMAVKLRKLGSDSLENSCSNDAINEQNLQAITSSAGGSTADETVAGLKEPLLSSLQYFLGQLERFTHSVYVSPKTYFVYRFIEMFVESGKDRLRPVLSLLPPTLIQHLLKLLTPKDFSVGLICRLYDLRSNTGRAAAVSDLCLWQNKIDQFVD